jgi:hypothetical protein
MAKKKYHVRKFLNKTKGMACIEIDANYNAWNFSCDVALTDCNRRIDLDFNMWSPKNIKEKLDKLDLLIDELAKLRAYLNEATVDFAQLNAASEKKNGSKGIISILEDTDD